MNRGNIRILYINDFLNGGGAEVVLSQLMDGVRDEGFSVELFYGEESNASAAVNPFSYIYSRKYRNKLLKMLWEYKPHVIHILNYYHILTPSILDALKVWKNENPGTRVIHTAHDFHLLCPSSGLTSYPFCSGRLKREPPGRIQDRASLWLKRWDHRGILYSSLKAAQWAAAYRFSQKDAVIDTIICPGRFMFESMQKVFPDKSVHFIRNPYPGKAAAEKASGKKGDRLKLVFAGRIAQEKGLIPFLQSVSPDTWNYLSFDIYGNGPLMKEVEKIVDRLPRTAQCRVMGGREHEGIQEALPSYHMLVLPSLLYENAPLSLVEAAFAGLRLAVSSWGGAGMLAEFLGGDYLFNPEKPEMVNNVLKNAFGDVTNGNPVNRDYGTLQKAFDPQLFLQKHREIYLS